MTQPGVSTMTSQRIDRLLRSLVGVADVRLIWNPQQHTLRAVHILRDSRTQPHQLIRNIVSGMQAAFNVQLLPTQIHVHEDAAVLDAIGVTAEVFGEPVEPAPSNGNDAANGNGANGNGNDGAHTNGHASTARSGGQRSAHDALRAGRSTRPAIRRDAPDEAPLAARPSPRGGEVIAAAADLLEKRASGPGLMLERIDLERRGAMIRCHTALSLAGRTYSAIAEILDSPSAEAEIAARVALDALRAGGLTEAVVDGVGFITIAQTNYCVATVRESGNAAPRAGIAPLIDSMAASATAAVLTAIGTFTDARAVHRARAGH